MRRLAYLALLSLWWPCSGSNVLRNSRQRSSIDESDGARLAVKQPVHINADEYPLVFNMTSAGMMVLDTSFKLAQSSNGYTNFPSNPKNGTPWYRTKKKNDAGQSSHSHFGGLTSSGDFKTDMLEAHNSVRRYAGLSDLRWNDEIAAIATDRVKTLASEGCYIQHSPTSDRWHEAGFRYLGENLYKVINMVPTGVDIVDAWYAEIDDYSYGPVGAACTSGKCNGRSAPPCTLGHFTQVMWEPTTDIGCGLAECGGQEQRTFIAVCDYGPGGNIVGRLPFSQDPAYYLGLETQPCTRPHGTFQVESEYSHPKDRRPRSLATQIQLGGVSFFVIAAFGQSLF